MVHDPLAWVELELDQLSRQHLLRKLACRTGPQQSEVLSGGEKLINFGANDYLGLAADPRLGRAVTRAIETDGWGSGASPLITGRTAAHAELENSLADFEGTEAALLFATGFAANVSTLAAIVDRGDVIFSDEKNHASIIDGCRLSRAEVKIFSHCDYDSLADQLASYQGVPRRLIVSDSLFSMDGDLADLARLSQLAQQSDSMLLIDEAHATGVFGKLGRGVAEHQGVESESIIRVGTLSKALGCAGGFVAGRQTLIHWLANRARSYVFSTATPAACSAAVECALEIVRQEPFRRQQLLKRASDLRARLSQQGWNLGPSASQIIPLIVGSPEKVLQLSARLRDQGMLVPAIRPPTVPAGESLLRISLSYAHTEAMIDSLVTALQRLR